MAKSIADALRVLNPRGEKIAAPIERDRARPDSERAEEPRGRGAANR